MAGALRPRMARRTPGSAPLRCSGLPRALGAAVMASPALSARRRAAAQGSFDIVHLKDWIRRTTPCLNAVHIVVEQTKIKAKGIIPLGFIGENILVIHITGFFVLQPHRGGEC